MDTRLKLIQHWLTDSLDLDLERIEPASADASFRRYFRATCATGVFIVMDAPPEQESISEFIDTDRALAKLGVHVPEIKASNQPLGLLLLEDLGTRIFLDELTESPDRLYTSAINALILLQTGNTATTGFTPPAYSAEKLAQEMDLFSDWFIGRHLRASLNQAQLDSWGQTKKILIDSFMEQPQTWVHRDFHSRNLMITNDNSPGVIDFQDMVIGPIAYDLASIFKDCYIEWSRPQQLSWLVSYHQLAGSSFDFEQLIRWYDLCGLQRHLKVLGIFCRLNYRDNKNQYLKDLPLVAKYVLETLRLYPEFEEFESQFKNFIEQAL